MRNCRIVRSCAQDAARVGRRWWTVRLLLVVGVAGLVVAAVWAIARAVADDELAEFVTYPQVIVRLDAQGRVRSYSYFTSTGSKLRARHRVELSSYYADSLAAVCRVRANMPNIEELVAEEYREALWTDVLYRVVGRKTDGDDEALILEADPSVDVARWERDRIAGVLFGLPGVPDGYILRLELDAPRAQPGGAAIAPGEREAGPIEGR